MIRIRKLVIEIKWKEKKARKIRIKEEDKKLVNKPNNVRSRKQTKRRDSKIKKKKEEKAIKIRIRWGQGRRRGKG